MLLTSANATVQSKRRQGDQLQHRARDQGKKANKNAHHVDQDASSDEVEYEMFKLSNKKVRHPTCLMSSSMTYL